MSLLLMDTSFVCTGFPAHRTSHVRSSCKHKSLKICPDGVLVAISLSLLLLPPFLAPQLLLPPLPSSLLLPLPLPCLLTPPPLPSPPHSSSLNTLPLFFLSLLFLTPPPYPLLPSLFSFPHPLLPPFFLSHPPPSPLFHPPSLPQATSLVQLSFSSTASSAPPQTG